MSLIKATEMPRGEITILPPNEPQRIRVDIVYGMPDFPHVVNHMILDIEDTPPKYLRLKRLLQFWRDKIDAPLKAVGCDVLGDQYKPSQIIAVDSLSYLRLS